MTLAAGGGIPLIDGLPDGVPVVCVGPGFLTRVSGQPRLRDGVFFEPSRFRWSAFRDAWPDAMLSADGRVMPLSAAFAVLADGERLFVRPDADTKLFDGGLYDLPALAIATGTGVDAATPVVVAPPVAIDAEWRFFVVDGAIAACSSYRRWGRPAIDGFVPHAAIERAADLARRWAPARIWCLDLADAQGRIGVVEANCFNAARFYGADAGRIVDAVNAALSAA